MNLLTNDEVIAINQDPLGKQAVCVHTIGDLRIYVKELEDGSHAVGFCNFGIGIVKLSFKEFGKLGIDGRQQVRDVWRQKNISTIDTRSGSFPLEVPAHGVRLYRFSSLR